MRSNGAGMCHLETFMQKHQLQKLPHFVSELMHEIRAITQRDAQAYPELSAELAAQGPAPRPAGNSAALPRQGQLPDPADAPGRKR